MRPQHAFERMPPETSGNGTGTGPDSLAANGTGGEEIYKIERSRRVSANWGPLPVLIVSFKKITDGRQPTRGAYRQELVEKQIQRSLEYELILLASFQALCLH
eukprot:GHVU01212736.1.p1 GENE.GHVU01212736.1~~GHVU01212736.1.p1  ORF type:complete len:103 (+),score=8.13 GHVU01212736.1:449-757(+)